MTDTPSSSDGYSAWATTELVRHAGHHRIDISNAVTRSDIIEAIEAHDHGNTL